MKLKNFTKKKRKIKRRAQKRKPQYKRTLRKRLPLLLNIMKALAFLGVAAVVLHFMFFSGHFNISYVAIYGTDRFVNSADILEVANQNLLNQNIFLYKEKEVANKLKENFLGAAQIELKNIYPDTVDVYVIEREPIAIIYQNPEEKFLVDIDGYVLGYTSPDNENLPQIHYKKDISVGLFIDKSIVPMYLELTDLLKSENISVSSMSFHDKHVSFSLNKGEQILVGLEKNKSEVVQAISALLKEAELKSKTIQRIDLRYDKVIVLFN